MSFRFDRWDNMAYTVDQIKVAAYNRSEKPDFTITERNLFLGLAYCYDWFKLHPEDKDDCAELMEKYVQFFSWATEKGLNI